MLFWLFFRRRRSSGLTPRSTRYARTLSAHVKHWKFSCSFNACLSSIKCKQRAVLGVGGRMKGGKIFSPRSAVSKRVGTVQQER